MKKKVYLSGGLRSNWQEEVVSRVYAEFSNPITNKSEGLTLEESGAWCLNKIRDCDIVLAYMENTNPSGIGLSMELGYAKALGKTVILVLEPENEHLKDKYLQVLRNVSDVVYSDIDEAIEYLKMF